MRSPACLIKGDAAGECLPRLRALAAQRILDHHDAEALDGGRLSDMALDEKRRQIRRAVAAGACHPVAIDDEDLVRDRRLGLEAVDEILMMEPTDAASVALQQARFLQDEDAGAKPGEAGEAAFSEALERAKGPKK